MPEPSLQPSSINFTVFLFHFQLNTFNLVSYFGDLDPCLLPLGLQESNTMSSGFSFKTLWQLRNKKRQRKYQNTKWHSKPCRAYHCFFHQTMPPKCPTVIFQSCHKLRTRFLTYRECMQENVALIANSMFQFC